MPRIYVIRPAIERFTDLYVPEPNSGCWLWTGGSLGSMGYGAFSPAGATFKVRGVVYAHRFAYEHFVGPVPAGLCVLHRCDTPPCVNPDHLFLGTQLENVRDMMAKGRDRFGFGGGHLHSRVVAQSGVSGEVPAGRAPNSRFAHHIADVARCCAGSK